MTQILYKQRSSIRKGETIRGMNFVSPLVEYKFNNQNSEQISKKYFPDADNLQQGKNNLILDAIDETKNGYDFKRYDFFSDKNRDGKINPNEELIFKLLLFVSTDGNKVKECYEVVKPAYDEIIFFLETDSDSLSEQKLFGRVSEKIRKTYINTSTGKLYSSFFNGNVIDAIQKYLNKANKAIIEELFINGHITDKSISADFFSGLRYLLMALSAPTKALGWVMNKIGDGIDFLKIPDEFWDTENENYSFNKENIIENLSISTDKLAILKNLFTDKKGFDLADITPKMLDDIILNQLAVIESFVGKYNSYVKTEIEDIFKTLELPEMEMVTDSIAQPIALICGVWNGLVDFVSSIFKFIGMLLEAPFDISKDAQHILEMIDNFWDMLKDGSLLKNLKNAVDIGMKQMVEYLKNKDTGDINWVRIYYIGGFSISFAATFFIPIADLAKITEVGQIGDILVKINQEISKTAKFVKLQTAEAYQKASKALEDLLKLLAKGGQQLEEFVNNLWKKIADWFIKNKELLISAYDKAVLEGWKRLAKFFKARIVRKIPEGWYIRCFEYKNAIIPVDKVLMFARGKVKDIEKFQQLRDELAKLNKWKNTKGSSFYEDAKLNNEYLKKLKSRLDNIDKSVKNSKTLEKIGVIDNDANNKKIFDLVLAEANKNFTKWKPKPNNTFTFVIKGPKGNATVWTAWKKIEDGKLILTTIHIW